jgi:hypothetical protein
MHTENTPRNETAKKELLQRWSTTTPGGQHPSPSPPIAQPPSGSLSPPLCPQSQPSCRSNLPPTRFNTGATYGGVQFISRVH